MKKAIRNFLKSEAGFSLIELAIGLIIVGLLISGAMKGKELIEAAKINMTVRNLEKYKAATYLFQDFYGALPGDFSEASERIDPSLKNGPGNGILQGPGLDPASSAGNFWAHLSKAGFIQDVGVPPRHGCLRPNQGVPSEKIGGVLTIEHNPDGLQGHWFILGSPHGSSNRGALLAPAQALSLIQKMDGPCPTSGKAQARTGEGAHDACLEGDRFKVQNKEASCILYVQL